MLDFRTFIHVYSKCEIIEFWNYIQVYSPKAIRLRGKAILSTFQQLAHSISEDL